MIFSASLRHPFCPIRVQLCKINEAGTTHVSQIGLFARVFEGGQVRGELRHEHRSASGDRPR
jgi:hypothetical protein